MAIATAISTALATTVASADDTAVTIADANELTINANDYLCKLHRLEQL